MPSQAALPNELSIVSDGGTLDVRDALGRTEDVRISRSGARAVIPDYSRGALLLVGLDVSDGVVRVTWTRRLHDPALSQAHGAEFVADDVVVVADRGAGLVFWRLVGPVGEPPTGLEAIPVDGTTALAGVRQPGSVRRVPSGGDDAAMLAVCDNAAHRVLLVTVRRDGAGLSLGDGPAVTCPWLWIPDGVASTADGAWLAVSSHGNAAVAMLRRGVDGYRPEGVLRGAAFPHGLCFASDGRRVFVADAGTPRVLTYEGDGDWSGVRHPVGRLTVVDEQTFRRGNVNPQEGGPKGCDLTAAGAVLLVTCEEQPLAAFRADVTEDAQDSDAWDADSLVLAASAVTRTTLEGMHASHEAAVAHAHSIDALRHRAEDDRASATAELERVSRAYEDTVSAHRGLIERHDALAAEHAALAERHAQLAERRARAVMVPVPRAVRGAARRARAVAARLSGRSR